MNYGPITSQEQFEEYKRVRESYRDTLFCPKKAAEIRQLNKYILEWMDKDGKEPAITIIKRPIDSSLTAEASHKLYIKEYMRQYHKNKKAAKDGSQ